MSATEDRAKHIAWCQQRAMEYVDQGMLSQALAGLVADLTKFPHTTDTSMALRIMQEGRPVALSGDAEAMRAFIRGVR